MGQLFDALVTLHQAGEPVADILLLADRLQAMNLPASVRCNAELADFARLVPVASHACFYAAGIRKGALLRKLHAIGIELTARAAEPVGKPADVAAWFDAQLQGIGQRQSSPVVRFDAVAAEVLADLERPQRRGRLAMTGLPSVDEFTGGLAGGELIVLAARPGVGKSALAQQVAMHNANAGRSVLFVSLEMSHRELVQRELCALSGVDSRFMRGQTVCGDQRKRLARAAEQIGDAPIFVWPPPSATLSAIRAVARQRAAADPLGLLIVDYLQLVRPETDERRLPRYEQVTAVSAGLKILARELGVPILCLAQLNREADGQEPRLAHLRESGAIEQDADMVLFLNPLNNVDESRLERELIVAKHRHGDTGTLKLVWLPAMTRFADTTEEFT